LGDGLPADRRQLDRHGDVLVHRVNGEAHTLRAGKDGLSALAFGERGASPGAGAV
jgi:hypothetical protein